MLADTKIFLIFSFFFPMLLGRGHGKAKVEEASAIEGSEEERRMCYMR